MKEPGPDHPIAITATGARVVVRWNGVVLAESDLAQSLLEARYPIVYYIPRADVDMTRLELSDHATFSPFKGEASYYSIVTKAGRLDNAVWSYERPFPACTKIAGHLSFYTDKVEIDVIEAP
ncbi:MAG: DUF427 domain-containing protein [Pseudomonadota bacterium]